MNTRDVKIFRAVATRKLDIARDDNISVKKPCSIIVAPISLRARLGKYANALVASTEGRHSIATAAYCSYAVATVASAANAGLRMSDAKYARAVCALGEDGDTVRAAGRQAVAVRACRSHSVATVAGAANAGLRMPDAHDADTKVAFSEDGNASRAAGRQAIAASACSSYAIARGAYALDAHPDSIFASDAGNIRICRVPS